MKRLKCTLFFVMVLYLLVGYWQNNTVGYGIDISKIFYVTGGSNNCLYSINTNGSDKQKINNFYYIEEFEWNIDGNQSVLSYFDSSYDDYAAIIDQDGNILKTISGKEFSSPFWIDSNSFVYGVLSGGIFRQKLSENEPIWIVMSAGYVFDHCPTISPDGTKMAIAHHEWGSDCYVSWFNFDEQEIPYQGENHYVNYLNPKFKLIFSGTSTFNEDLNLSWTPDSQKLVFGTSSGDGAIYIASSFGEQTDLVEIKNSDKIKGFELSHSGQKIVYNTANGIYLTNIDGSGTKKISSQYCTSNLSWSSDDEYITFAYRGELFILDISGNLYKVTEELDHIKIVAWSPKMNAIVLPTTTITTVKPTTTTTKPTTTITTVKPTTTTTRPTTTTTLKRTNFWDLNSSHWAYSYITYLAEKDIISGFPDGSFGPDNITTRAEFTKLLISLIGEKESSGNSTFTDTYYNWAKGYIKRAEELGIIKGYPGGEFRPSTSITRAEFIAMIIRAKKPQITIDSSYGYADVSDNHWAYRYILTANEKNIITGYPDATFKPDNMILRSEAAKIVYEVYTRKF